MASKVDKPVSRTIEELVRALSNLRKANELWEQGHFEQSENIATILRLLLLDTPSSTSIFQQLDMKQVDFYANPLYVPMPGTSSVIRYMAYPHSEGLILGQQQRATVRWQAVYGMAKEAVDCPFPIDYVSPWVGLSFQDWWHESILPGDSFSYTREQFIKTLANRLGGAHSDSQISQHELDLVEQRYGYGFSSIALVINGVRTTPENKQYEAVMRQISYEVERTVACHFQQYLTTANVVPPLPFNWGGLDGLTMRDMRSTEEKSEIYEQCVAHKGEWSGTAEFMRSEIYWDRYRAQKRPLGL